MSTTEPDSNQKIYVIENKLAIILGYKKYTQLLENPNKRLIANLESSVKLASRSIIIDSECKNLIKNVENIVKTSYTDLVNVKAQSLEWSGTL
jgi:hypothetical protein